MAEEAHSEEKHGSGSLHGGGHGGGGHGGGGGHEEGHEGAPEWLISFADNVALLMGFFVILLAMNMGPKSTPVQGGVPDSNGGGGPDMAMETIISIREAFKNAHWDPTDPNDAKIIKYITDKKKRGEAVEDGLPGKHANVANIKPGEWKREAVSVSFDDRSAALNATEREKIAAIAEKLRDTRWIIEVRGHVSPFEEMRDSVKGWKLSHERAEVVALALIEAGLKRENLRLVLCGSADRVVGRTSDPQLDRNNQRVEVIATNETVAGDYYAAPASHEGAAAGVGEEHGE